MTRLLYLTKIQEGRKDGVFCVLEWRRGGGGGYIVVVGKI